MSIWHTRLREVFEDWRLVCDCLHEEDAERIVQAMNAQRNVVLEANEREGRGKGV